MTSDNRQGTYYARDIGGKNLMTELAAAVLEPQLEDFSALHIARRTAALDLVHRFSDDSNMVPQAVALGVEHAWQRVAFTLPTARAAADTLSRHTEMERFYTCALVDEPIIRERAICNNATRRQAQDLFSRTVGITLPSLMSNAPAPELDV